LVSLGSDANEVTVPAMRALGEQLRGVLPKAWQRGEEGRNVRKFRI